MSLNIFISMNIIANLFFSTQVYFSERTYLYLKIKDVLKPFNRIAKDTSCKRTQNDDCMFPRDVFDLREDSFILLA